MAIRKLALSTALVLSFALVACSPDCVAVCEDVKDGCEALETDCEDACDAYEEIAEEEGCEEEFDEWLECLDDLETKSCENLRDDCGDEGDDMEDCVQDFCTDNPNSSSCNDVFE